MATFIWAPDWRAQQQRRPRVRVAQFGDGYQQRSADGINADPRVWQLTFGNRDDTEAAAIEAFLAARGALEAFDWTPPTGSAGTWVCPQWASTLETYGATTITATFSEVFEP